MPEMPVLPPENGSATRTSRRAVIGAGGGIVALSAPCLSAPAVEPRPVRRIRGVIVLLLEGGISQYEAWDPKPEAPAEIRGPFATLRTTNPDLLVGELMPRLARQAHMYSVIRTLRNPGAGNHDHALHRILTGHPHPSIQPPADVLTNPLPSQGAVVARELSASTPRGLPPFLVIPNRTQLGMTRRLLGAGYLGNGCEAFESGPLPARSDDRYQVPPGLGLGPGMTLQRIGERRRLLEEFDRLRRVVDRQADDFAGSQRRAFDLVLGERGRAALDLNAESSATREAYGDSVMGQGSLLARRLVAAGVPYVLVNLGNCANLWDTHANHFDRSKSELMPPMDRAVSALLSDLDQRGMLDDTLVVMLSEFGRTPQINRDAGRDHWTEAFSIMLAGGGLKRGCVLGRTTRGGEEPAERPVEIPELLATIYHLLGIPPGLILNDREGRPTPILPASGPIRELL